MAEVNKNQAMINYLITCPQILNSSLYFNYINVKDNSKLLYTISESESMQKQYIDGSKLKTYSMTIVDYKSTSDIEVVKSSGYTNENVEEMLDMQGVIDWIHIQNGLRNFPSFGDKCHIEKITTSTDTPNLDGFYTDQVPPIARYSITIQVEYLDTTMQIWR